jgi:hypothetical protein
VEARAHARDRLLLQAPVRVDALAQARDRRPPLELSQSARIVELGDEQAGRVRADVDRADAPNSDLSPSRAGASPPRPDAGELGQQAAAEAAQLPVGLQSASCAERAAPTEDCDQEGEREPQP